MYAPAVGQRTQPSDMDGQAAQPCEIACKSLKTSKPTAACQGGPRREKLREAAHLQNSVTHALREVELRFQSQNSRGLRDCKIAEALTITRHHLLDVQFLQET